MVTWLEWLGWGGISGIVALVALAAALVVTFIEVRAWWLTPPRIADMEVNVSGDTSDNPEQKLTFRFRVIGPHTLHEVVVRRIGPDGAAEKLGDTVGVLDARDGFVERVVTVRRFTGQQNFVASWQTRTRAGKRMGGVRFSWGGTTGFQDWKNFRWPFWPRKTDGRWVDRSWKPSRGARGIYLPVTPVERSEVSWMDRHWQKAGRWLVPVAVIGPILVILGEGRPQLYFALIGAIAALIAATGAAFRLHAHGNQQKAAWDGLGKWCGFASAALVVSSAATALALAIV